MFSRTIVVCIKPRGIDRPKLIINDIYRAMYCDVVVNFRSRWSYALEEPPNSQKGKYFGYENEMCIPPTVI